MSKKTRFTALVTVSMITGALLHLAVRQPAAKGQAALPTATKLQEPNKAEPRMTVVCQLAGRGLVLSMVPEGTVVKKADLLCELDASELRDRLTEREIAVKQSENEVRACQLAQEVALMALNEYQEGTFLHEKAAIELEIKRDQSTLAQTSDRLDKVNSLYTKGETSKAQKVSAELAIQGTRFALEMAQNKLQVLLNTTRPNTILRLRGELERNRSQAMTAKEILELRRSMADRTRQQIERCRITAPCDGRVVYMTTPAGAKVQEGDQVHERQPLVRIVPAVR